jgi:hypothetical protein
MFEKLPIPISNIVLILGVVATAWGFYEYNDPTLNLIGIFAGIPLLLGGITMKVVELKPIPPLSPTSPEVEQARQTQATEIQKQVRADITKYSYGANAHLEDALEFLGLEGEVEADLPKLIGYRDELRDGRYTLVLRFRSEFVELEKWQQSYEKKMQGFFGRDVAVVLEPMDNNLIELALIAKASQTTAS